MWQRYRAAIFDRFRAELLGGLPDAPMEPSMLVVSALVVSQIGEPRFENFRCDGGGQAFPRLRVLGRTWNLPAQPYATRVCQAPRDPATRVAGPGVNHP